MGYDIRPISELETLDFSNLDQKKETVRKSIDGSKFIISGNNINVFTQEEMITITQTAEWSIPFII